MGAAGPPEPTPALLRRVLDRTGVALPRGVVWQEARALAGARVAESPDGAERAGDLSRRHWPELRAPIEAALRAAAGRAGEEDAEMAAALVAATEEDPGNPLAMVLAVRAGGALAAALRRSADRLRAAEARMAGGGPEAIGAATAAAGAIGVDLVDLDPEDFEPEIAEYVGAGESDEALRRFARETADHELRAWLRDALAGVDAPDAPQALAVVRGLAAGPPPEDPAEDPLWLAALLALAQGAVELALAADLEEAD